MTVPESELDEAGGVLWGANATGEFAFEDTSSLSLIWMEHDHLPTPLLAS